MNVTASSSEGGHKLAALLKQLRLQKKLTQEQLAERAGLLDPHVNVSVDTVRALERSSGARSLPRRRPPHGRFAVELILEALDAQIADVLCSCFNESELHASSFAWVVNKRAEKLRDFSDILGRRSLSDFIRTLPDQAAELLELPGVIQLQNAEAFAYIFSLERCYEGLEMLVVNEPPIVLLSAEDVDVWASGMRLNDDDRRAFTSHVRDYQAFFFEQARSGHKRYQVVLSKRGLERFLRHKSKAGVRAFLELTSRLLESERNSFELVLLDAPGELEELEVISRHQRIPTSLADTLSVVIRQSSMTADWVEYSLVPMPPSLSGLQRDIARIEQLWSLGLDQYRALSSPTGYWLDVSEVTGHLLLSLASRFS